MNPVIDTPAPLSRPARVRLEFKTLLALALPIMVAQLATTAMGFVDAVMAGRVGPRDLAAVALGNSIWVPVFLLMTGTLLATTPKVAQRFGAGTFDEIGPLVRQALWLALVVGLIATLALFSAEPILHIMKVDPELIGPCMEYLRGIGTGLPAVALYHVLRCFSDGLGRTRPAMVLGLCGLALNIPLNYIFIYGHLGVPAMGGVGCGWATAIVMWVMALGMAGWARWAPAYQSSRLFSRFDWPQWAVIKRLLGIGLPIGIAVFAESSIFAVIALLIGSLGATVVAGHQIALNFSSLVFMIPYSLGMAVTVRVGQALGRQQLAKRRFRRPEWAWAPPWPTLASREPDVRAARAYRGDLYRRSGGHRGGIDADRLCGAVSVFRCDPGHGGWCIARLPGHPGDDDPDPVRLLGHRPAGGLRPGPDRLARRGQRSERVVARPDRGLELRGTDVVDPSGT